MSKPRIWTLDIETCPIKAYVWALWDQNIGLNQIAEEWSILSFGAKEYGTDRVIYHDTSQQRNIRDDRRLMKKLWTLLDGVDIIIAQNGQRFDVPKINSRMLMAGLPPYSPIRVIDTLAASKKHFRHTSNKLEWVSKYHSQTPKLTTRKFAGFDLWDQCMKRNPAAWAEMKEYNLRDVQATEEYYTKIRPWMTTHPNLGAYVDGTQHNCPNCGSTHVTKQGTNVTQQGRRQQFQCQDCGTWSHGKVQVISAARRKMLLK